MIAALVVVSTLALILMRVPVVFALIVPSCLYLVFDTSLSLNMVALRMTTSIDSFPLLAVPMFIFVGYLANAVGVSERIMDFASALIGRVRGSLGYVNVLTSFGFSWMNGTALADAAGSGLLLVPQMKKRGYRPRFTVGLTAASSVISPVMPPSIPAIIYATTAGVSIGAMFAAGVIPALLLLFVLFVAVFVMTRRQRAQELQSFAWMELVRTGRRVLLPALAPAIILGGILGGVFTPTEASAIAAVYVLLLGLVYRKLTARLLGKIIVDTGMTVSNILLVAAGATVFGVVLSRESVPQALTSLLTSISDSPIVFLLVVNVALLVIGAIIEPMAAILIVVPILLPSAVAYGIDPVHLGVIVVLNLMIGLMTPPVGLLLFMMSEISGETYGEVLRGVLPFYLYLVVALLIVTLVPAISLWLPGLIL